jgi:hypothetical protein
VRLTALVVILLALAGCGRASNQPATAPDGHVLSSATSAPASAPATSAPAPVSNVISGRVVRLIPDGAVVDSAGQEYAVDLRSAVEIWKETTVTASAITVGDDLFVTGTPGSPFVATNVWADIGVLAGVIKDVDKSGMLVEIHAVQGGVGDQRIDFSPHVVFGAPSAGITTARGDLVPGRAIGMVIFRPASGPLRATRVWLD